MTTATLKKRSHKNPPRRHPSEGWGEDDRSAAFFMPAGSMSLAEFRQWTYSKDFPQTGLIAYIGKEIFIDMSPERLISHVSVKTEVCTVVNGIVRKKKKGKFYSDRSRLTNVAADVSNEPDGMFVSWASFRNGKVRFVPTVEGDDYIELEGTPDWILEVVSKSSVTKDKKRLRTCYHRAGISEYWLIDARGDDVDFQILVHDRDDYIPAGTDGQWQVSKVFGKRFRLRRITDQLGNIDYRLNVK